MTIKSSLASAKTKVANSKTIKTIALVGGVVITTVLITLAVNEIRENAKINEFTDHVNDAIDLTIDTPTI